MSIFKRLRNVGKGKVLDWTRDDAPRKAMREVERELDQMLEAARRFAGAEKQPSDSETAATNPTDELLQKLEKYRDSGIFTQEEYEAKRADILAKTGPAKPKPAEAGPASEANDDSPGENDPIEDRHEVDPGFVNKKTL